MDARARVLCKEGRTARTFCVCFPWHLVISIPSTLRGTRFKGEGKVGIRGREKGEKGGGKIPFFLLLARPLLSRVLPSPFNACYARPPFLNRLMPWIDT